VTHAIEITAKLTQFFWRRFLVCVSRAIWHQIQLVPDSSAD